MGVKNQVIHDSLGVQQPAGRQPGYADICNNAFDARQAWERENPDIVARQQAYRGQVEQQTYGEMDRQREFTRGSPESHSQKVLRWASDVSQGGRR